MKKHFTLTIILAAGSLLAQQNYCDFDGTKLVVFGHYNGLLDSNVANPGPNTVNSSAQCGRYIRDTVQFDNFKVFPNYFLADVTPYATASGPKITLKVYSTAPVGSKIELQLGSQSYLTYPAGVHSQYTATTASSKTWEMLTFNHLISPSGSSVSPTAVNKIVVLYRPNTHNNDTLYFDDLTGPEIQAVPVGLNETQSFLGFELFQNRPNPSTNSTLITARLVVPGPATLTLFNMLGEIVASVDNPGLNVGLHSFPIHTEHLANGVYFYTLKQGNQSQSLKMVVAH